MSLPTVEEKKSGSSGLSHSHPGSSLWLSQEAKRLFPVAAALKGSKPPVDFFVVCCGDCQALKLRASQHAPDVGDS